MATKYIELILTMKSIDYHNLKVLLAEDDELSQQIVTTLLHDKGIKVDIATNGQEALSMSGSTDYDVILMDMEMPEMDGLRAASAIRRREKESGKHTPILALTANSFSSDLEACGKAGMDDYLTKPFRVEDMVVKLSNLPGEDKSTSSGEDFHSKGALASTDPVLDVASLVVELGEESAYRLMRLFAISGGRHIDEIRSGIRNEDMTRIKQAAHKLKGTAGQYRASGLIAPASELAYFESQSDYKKAADIFSILEIEFRKVVRVIKEVAKE